MHIDLSWKVAAKNLLRNQRRSLSTAMALVSGLIGLVLLSAYVHRVHKGLEVSTVYINHKGHIALLKKDSLKNYYTRPSKYMLDTQEQAQAADLINTFSKEVDFTGKYLTSQGLLSNGEKSVPFAALGAESDIYLKVATSKDIQIWAKDWVHDDFIPSARRFAENPLAVSITPNLAVLIKREPPFTNLTEDQKTVQLAGQSVFGDLNAVDAELGPIHSTGVAFAEDTSIIVGLKRLQELIASDGVQYIAIFLKDATQTSSVYKEMNEIIKEKNLNIEVFPYYDAVWGSYYRGSMSFLLVMGGFFTVLICLGVALSIINSSTMNILERTKEIGTLMSLGFPRQYVVKLFVKEMTILAFGCLVFGLVAATIVAEIVNAMNFRFKPPGVQGDVQFVLSQTWGLSISMSVILGLVSIISCWYVTRRMTRKKIIDLLSTTGA